MNRLLFLIFFLIPGLAFADGEPVPEKEICKILEPQQQAKQVAGADYVPEVDVHGKRVASAEVGGSTNFAKNPIEIPIALDLAQRYGLNLPQGMELKPSVADLKIHQDGRVTYNDQDITKKVKSSCENQQKTAAEPVKTDGHKAADAVVSSDKIDGQYPDYNE